MLRPALILAAAALLALSLGACRSSRFADQLSSTPNAGPCPAAGSIYDAARIVKFAPGSDALFPNIEYTAEITDVRLFCRYLGGDPLLAEVEIDFAFGRGPQGRAERHVYPYFVAVTRQNGRVLARETYAVEADFRRGRVTTGTELINRIRIPRADESISGVNFEVLVGFELTPEQAEFNRSGQRFRLDAVLD
jgi:hypothetical protein